jgi:hypothetical protein
MAEAERGADGGGGEGERTSALSFPPETAALWPGRLLLLHGKPCFESHFGESTPTREGYRDDFRKAEAFACERDETRPVPDRKMARRLFLQ